MSHHELTFPCRVRGFAIDPRLSLGILVLGSFATLVVSAYIPDLLDQLTGPSRSIAIRGPGWVLLGILVVPLLCRLAEHRHAVGYERRDAPLAAR